MKASQLKPKDQSGRALEAMLERISHLLPQQAPLHAFVHHNTLHAFESDSFDVAVQKAGKTFKAEPYQSEESFASHLKTGRINERDLAFVVDAEFGPEELEVQVGGLSFKHFVLGRLSHLFPVPQSHTLAFHMEEMGLGRHRHPMMAEARAQELFKEKNDENAEKNLLKKLWGCFQGVDCSQVPRSSASTRSNIRLRDSLFSLTERDIDEVVHPQLIKLCAAYLDQGIAYWHMPDRSKGFLNAVRQLYSRNTLPWDRFGHILARKWKKQELELWSAQKTIDWALSEMGITADSSEQFLQETLLALPGWAGMMAHFEQRPDHAPVVAVPATLIDFLAVRLVLEVAAAKMIIEDHFDKAAYPLSKLKDYLPAKITSTQEDLGLCFEAYVLAQLLPVSIEAFNDPDVAKTWLTWVAQVSALERRRWLHLAYEAHYRHAILDGLVAYSHREKDWSSNPRFQAIFCIDDREESLRRHLEECLPSVETFGYAGFFGAAMNFQSLDDIRERPLAPVSIRPIHVVKENVSESTHLHRYRSMKRKIGRLHLSFAVGSHTLTRGGFFTAFIGPFALIPLVMQSLFPRLAVDLRHWWDKHVNRRPHTKLHIESHGETGKNGFTVEDMAGIVSAALKTMHMEKSLSPLVFVVGHGSSSLNNPHRAAYDCGATGGGHGGPNARAFAMMANDPRVREWLRQKCEIRIEPSTWFVGASHNTCDDEVEYFDEDAIPQILKQEFLVFKSEMKRALLRNAHERCRRFESIPKSMNVDHSLDCVKLRANNLAEPRPECGHATNAICIVGRRSRTKGLFLDRRAFLVSYDPTDDANGDILSRLLLSVGPVGAGINLEYYFSAVDPIKYGCGTKLPHNVTGLIGIMDGHASDLRTGLPWQMVEIHEPMRLLTIVDAKAEMVAQILKNEKALATLVENAWIQLVAWDPDTGQMTVFQNKDTYVHQPFDLDLPRVLSSFEHYRMKDGHLPVVVVENDFRSGRDGHV